MCCRNTFEPIRSKKRYLNPEFTDFCTFLGIFLISGIFQEFFFKVQAFFRHFSGKVFFLVLHYGLKWSISVTGAFRNEWWYNLVCLCNFLKVKIWQFSKIHQNLVECHCKNPHILLLASHKTCEGPKKQPIESLKSQFSFLIEFFF